MIIVDEYGHMTSTENVEELHNFAEELGFRRTWFQSNLKHCHYDLTTMRMINKAIRMGATKVTSRELVKQSFWRKSK